ncbi:lysM domain receptor-like kinase 3 [Dendrobium catenatum]|uniref:LysM domain receptor-like kinase 3 n=1 Tax=Dendrobium catenatum TaxID=906689 RepID=A0A2I0WER2_9ASPA|nr:lysM domain receptor-like kinase 3 [Dendrobium catenatum]PKU74154.1 LysM domain receptor-like kinase 3 [Dendrobium catenatum]
MPERRISSPPIVRSDSPMCGSRGDAQASEPRPRSATRSTRSRSSEAVTSASSSSFTPSIPTITDSSSAAAAATTSSSSSLSISSIASLRGSLPEKPILFPSAEIAAATNNFLAKRISPSSSSSWRCSLRGHDTVVIQRSFRGDPAALRARLAAVCKSNHRSIVRLLGASLSDDRIFLVYDFVAGASLADCLRNQRNPNFTPLSSWISRIQVASDLAQGLEYIHDHSAGGGIVHNRIKSSAIIVTELHFNALICHFGASFLAGEIPEEASTSRSKMNRVDSHLKKINGTRGYLAPEVVAGGGVSRRSDVFALGVLLLELISGEVPIKLKFDPVSKEYQSTSLIQMARDVFGEAGLEEEGTQAAAESDLVEGRRMRIRQWVDRRLKDSFPVDVVEDLMGIALRCVEVEAEKRPSMAWVQGKVSRLFLKSKVWAERVRPPADFSVSLAPR